MAVSRFRSLGEENIAQLLNDKDSSENTKRSTKQHRLIFESYLQRKNIRNTTTAVEPVSGCFTKVLRRGEKKKMDRCTQKTPFVPSDFLCVDTSNKN